MSDAYLGRETTYFGGIDDPDIRSRIERPSIETSADAANRAADFVGEH